MLKRLALQIKGAAGARLSYAEIVVLIEPSLLASQPLSFLTESAHASWESVTGGDASSFHEHWRTNLCDPFLCAIAREPTHALQRRMVKSALLDQEELGKWAGVILKCSKEDSEEVLADYPGGAASENTIDWKREHVALELCFSSMSTAVLLDLGAKGFGIDTKNFELWLRFYAEAYGQKIAQDVLLSSLSTSTHDNARKVSSAEMRRKHIVANTMSVLSAMREEILNECPDIERNQERYNDLAVVTNELLARVES